SANIILDDADLEMAVDGSLFGCFFHQGQACESGTRLFVPESLHDKIVAQLVERTKLLNCGDPLDLMSARVRWYRRASARPWKATSRPASRRGPRSPSAASGRRICPKATTSSRRSLPT